MAEVLLNGEKRKKFEAVVATIKGLKKEPLGQLYRDC